MDIVERLRTMHMREDEDMCAEAADEIERLREALEDVCDYGDLAAVRVARAALKGQS